MPRPLRLEYEGAWYHVMNRGAARQDIYKNDAHRNLFLNLLRETSLYYNVEFHGYCLMNNHYHLLIHTPQGNLSQAMRHINGLYTRAFNRLEKIDGPLFRGRYKAILIEEDAYLLQVSRYIHLNPVSAAITKKPEDYKWSSYPHYISNKVIFPWLHIDFIQEMISNRNRKHEYQCFVNYGLDDETKNFYEAKNQPVIFGGKEFKNKIIKNISEEQIKHSKADYNRTRELPSLSKISKTCSQYFKVPEKNLFRYQLGRKNLPRKLAMYYCRVFGQIKLEDIAKYFECKTKSGASNAVNKIKHHSKNNAALKKHLKNLDKLITDI